MARASGKKMLFGSVCDHTWQMGRDSLMTWVTSWVGRVTVVVSMWWSEGLRWVLLMTPTWGHLLVLGVNQLQRSDVVDSWMGVITGNYGGFTVSCFKTITNGRTSPSLDDLGRHVYCCGFDNLVTFSHTLKTVWGPASLRSSMEQLVWCLMHMWTSDEEVDICLVHVVRRRNPLSQYHHVRYRLMYEWSRESF